MVTAAVKFREWCCVCASVHCRRPKYCKWNETHEVKVELPHVFLKHKSEKTCMERKKKKQERRGKKARQLHGKGGRGVRGGLQAERHVNGERRASLTRSLARHFLLAESLLQLLLCVSLLYSSSSSQALLHFFFFFVFLWLAELTEVHCFSWRVLEVLKRTPAVLHCRTLHLIK